MSPEGIHDARPTRPGAPQTKLLREINPSGTAPGGPIQKGKTMMHLTRPLALLGFLLAVVGVLFGLTQSTANAQAPTSGVHFFYVTSHYQRPSHKAPANSVTNLTYYGGPVMLNTVTYTIFWTPSGHSMPSGYQALINRFFSEVGGSGLYNIMTQYHDASQQIQNSSTLGGTWVDTTPYPHEGTPSDPLSDADIRASVARALAANGWTPGQNHLYLVYTAPGLAECWDSNSCTPGTAAPEYCAYHSFISLNTETVVYAFMPYVETWTTQCRSFSTSPNGNIAADSVISMSSHELFEAITDIEPTPTGVAWHDLNCNDNTECGEIADKCEYRYGTPAADGSNVSLGSHRYIVQQEWSNADFSGASYSGCVLNYGQAGPQVFVDRAYTASNPNGKLKKAFLRGDKIFYFGQFRNDGSAACTTQGTWFAKGGQKTLVNLTDTFSVDPGTSNWYVRGRIPANAPLRKYTLTVSTTCNGQVTSARVNFKVIAGALPSILPDDAPAIEGPVRQ